MEAVCLLLLFAHIYEGGCSVTVDTGCLNFIEAGNTGRETAVLLVVVWQGLGFFYSMFKSVTCLLVVV